jgi:hypothetical protein
MEIFERGLPYKDQAPGSKAADHRGDIGQGCFASTKITLKFSDEEKFTMNFFGYEGYAEFGYSSMDPSTWFELYNDAGHSFLMGIGIYMAVLLSKMDTVRRSSRRQSDGESFSNINYPRPVSERRCASRQRVAITVILTVSF